MFTELNSAQAAPQAVDPRTRPASPATAAHPTPDGAGARRPGADNPPKLENLAAAAVDLDPAAHAWAAQRRGWWQVPLWPGTKRPMLPEGHPILLGERRLSDPQLAYYIRRGANFGVMLDPSGLVVVDVEAEGDAGPWAAHAAGGGPNTVVTWSGGRHAYYSRPPGVTARRVIKVRDADGRKLAADVISKGYAVLPGSAIEDPSKAPYQGRYAAPATFWTAELPTAPADVLAALAEPEAPARVPGLVPLPCDPTAALRAQAVIIGLVEHWCERIAPMLPKTGRRTAVFAAARAAFELIHHAPELESWVIARLTDAAHACALIQSDGEKSALANLDNGRRAGLATPLPLPADRPGWKAPAPKSTSSGNVVDDAERIRAAARARLDRLDQDLDAIAAEFFTIHCVSTTGREFTRPNTARRETVRLVVTRIYERAENMARSTFTYGVGELAEHCGRCRASVIGAESVLAAIGITAEPGRIGAEGLPLGRRWTVAGLADDFSAKADSYPLTAAGGAGQPGVNGLTPNCQALPKNTACSETGGLQGAGDVHISRANEAAGALCRGARARKGDPAPPIELRKGKGGTVEAKVIAIGPTAHLVIDALRRLGTGDTETISEAAGVSVRTAGETLRRLGGLDIATAEKVPTGERGRPRLIWALVTTTTAAVKAVIARGRAVIQKARDRAAVAFQSYTHQLRERVKETGQAAAAVGQDLARELKRRAAGERASAKGGERGRPDLGLSDWRGAVKAKGAELIARSTPPAWAVESIPPWAFGDATPAEADPVIAFALQLGGVQA